MKSITLLGATGSIGLRTLDLVSSFPEEFSVAALAARGSNVERVADLCKKYSPRAVALLETDARDQLARLLPAPRPELLAGPEGLVALARDVKADIVVSALVGGAGLLPTMAAIQAGRTVALANKETLVMAGRLMTAAARARGVKLLPVDSEHSAIFQCLAGHSRADVHRILLTASGGPFRETPKARLATVTVEDALQHPTWKMGAKITIDSATLMNKGLEVIEARWLFDVASDQVQIVVHPQSIVHSMVEYIDGCVIAQMGVADMGVPILYALTYPERRPMPTARLDLVRAGQLTFYEPDVDKFPCLRLARTALESNSSAPVVLNAANEIAVAAFLDRRIGFNAIAELIEEALNASRAGDLDSIEALVAVDADTRRSVQRAIDIRQGSALLVTTILSFVIVIGILILVHELGHFLVARWTGVGVERFSIGFGPVLARWRGKETEYCLSAIPMGGYVKMVGEENPLEGGGSPDYDPKKAFALKPLWARFLIVFAGPGMNFVLAAVIFGIVLATIGRPVSPAIVGRVADDGPAAAAGLQPGDTVWSIDGRPIAFWEELYRAIMNSQGRPLRLGIVRDGAKREVEITPRRVTVRDPIFKEEREEWDLGIGPQLTPQIGAVTPGSPAERAGLLPGDTVIGVAGQTVFTPDELTQAIQKRGGQTFEIVVKRDDKPVTLHVTATTVKEKNPTGQDVEIGRIGVGIVMKAVRYERYNPLQAMGYGTVRTWDMTVLTAKGLWKLVTLQLPLSNLGGPIQIAAEGERQRREGLPSLAQFTAIISVNLAVLNLLPVPMLDGGHLLFFVIEGILGRPVSLKKREAAQQLGLVLLLLLMVFAIYNDLVRIDAFRIFR